MRSAVLSTIRTPRVPHSVPKALSESETLQAIDAIGKLAKFDWIGKRDVAIMLLLYGCGLRISEALGAPLVRSPHGAVWRHRDADHHRQGQQAAHRADPARRHRCHCALSRRVSIQARS